VNASKYEFLGILLIFEILVILFGKPAYPLTILKELWVLGLFLIIVGIWLFVYWDIFWFHHVTKAGFKGVVSSGPFKHVRHPLMSASIILFFGIAIFFNSSSGLIIAIFSLVIMMFGARKEEKDLIRRFGAQYKKYQMKVKYKIIPKIY